MQLKYLSRMVISHLSLLKISISDVDRRQKTFYKREICKLASIPGKVISSSDQGAEVSSSVQPGLCLHAKHKIAEPTGERIWGM